MHVDAKYLSVQSFSCELIDMIPSLKFYISNSIVCVLLEAAARAAGLDPMSASSAASDATFRDIDRIEETFCCSDKLTDTMKSQVLAIEDVYSFL